MYMRMIFIRLDRNNGTLDFNNVASYRGLVSARVKARRVRVKGIGPGPRVRVLG